MSVLLCTFFPCVNSQQCNGYLASFLNSLRTRPRGWQARVWRVRGCAGSAGQHSVVGWAGMRPVLLLLSIAEVWAVLRGKLINNQINYFLNLDSQMTMIVKLYGKTSTKWFVDCVFSLLFSLCSFILQMAHNEIYLCFDDSVFKKISP